jgi:hypothetical protein
VHIYTKGISDITWADVESFCNTKVKENAYLDYKREFPTDLAKTVSAMANTFGGVTIIGVEEDGDGAPLLPVGGIPAERGLEERVVNTMVDAVSPPIIPEVAVCRAPDKSRVAVLVRVGPSTDAPHAMQSNTRVYVRTGNRNAPEELADLVRIQWLVNRREKAERLRGQLLGRASERFVHMRDGRVPGTPKTDEASQNGGNAQPGLLTLALAPVYPERPLVEAGRLETLAREIRVHDPVGTDNFQFPFPSVPTRLVQDGLVMHLSGMQGLRTYHAHLNVYGLYFFKQSLLYTVPENRRATQLEPHTFLRARELVARAYEMAQSGAKFYELIGYRGPLQFICSMDSVLGLPLRVDETCRYSADTDVKSSIVVSGVQLVHNANGIVHQLVGPVLLAFDWNLDEEKTLDLYRRLM